MSEKFILFNDEKINPTQLMMLTDLAKLILEDEDVKVSFQKFGYYHPLEKVMNVSFKWRHRGTKNESDALKSDCILYSYGYNLSDQQVIQDVISEDVRFPRFFRQLFVMIEEYRLIRTILTIRPAAMKFFKTRIRLKLSDNRSQIKVYQTKKVPTDLLFLQIEQALLTENILEMSTETGSIEGILKERLTYLFELKSTQDSYDLAMSINYIVEDYLTTDMLNDYYYLPVKMHEELQRFKETKSTDLAGTDDIDSEVEAEDVLMKHRNSATESGSYMQTEISEGQNSRAQSSNGREGDASDEATELLAGKGKSSVQKDGDGVDISESLGQQNENAELVWKKPDVDSSHKAQYVADVGEVMPEVKKLTSIIQKTIAHQNESARNHLAFGRLDRRLINWFTDDQKRVFYKEDQQSKELDATFTLLVDASYSMEDKLDETKKGIILFHETLKRLSIKHEVIAFNEDTFSSDHVSQRNIFDYIIDYQHSLMNHMGPYISTIKAQDDNRDGLAIRVAGEMIKRRSETQKFLIVFSDGEPSAFEYEANGIVDTHEAVNKLRREGIYVINVFLSQTPIDEATEQTIKNIYNDYCLFVEGVENLPYIVSPLLKRLILQSLH